MEIPKSIPDDYSASSPERPALSESFVVPAECAGLRLDQALARVLPRHSRSRLQAWLREGRIRVEGVVSADAKRKVWGGEKVEVEVSSAPDP
ncbi:MAG: S4 domain-containing protein, partial [Pseudomonadota bacterium]